MRVIKVLRNAFAQLVYPSGRRHSFLSFFVAHHVILAPLYYGIFGIENLNDNCVKNVDYVSVNQEDHTFN